MHKKKTEEMEADHQEFTRLIRENQAILYDFIKCRILDKSLAQDVLQETLYIAYKKWDQLKEHPNQTGFLIETARYKIQDFNKKTRKLQREIPIEGHEHIEAKDQYGKVELDIVLENDLDKEDKKRFSRYFVRGYKIPEMAKLENTSENNMSVRINRLRGKVAKIIYDGKVFDKKQKMSVRNDKKETHIIERDKDQASKPDNESLIQEIQKRLDWYTMEASDEEFDADEVQNLLKLLDSLTPEEEKDRLSSDEVVDNFWKYCAEREEEERILAEADETEKKKEHKVLHYFQKHRAVAVAAAVLIVIMLGGSWQMAVNAEKHGGFFWWMDKNEEGTTMITSPETHVRDSIKKVKENYYSIENVPQIYKKYVDIPYEIMQLYEEQYTMSRIQIVKADESDTIYEFFNKGQDEILHFEIKIYPRKILRVRETYPGYVFCEEFENDGINLEVFSKQEDNGNQSYIIYFYYGNEKYAVVGINDKDFLKEIAIKYQEAVVDNY